MTITVDGVAGMCRLSIVYFVAALGLLAGGCSHESCSEGDDKCASTSCSVRSEEALERPDAYMMSPDDVLSVTDGEWSAGSLSILVKKRSGESRYREPVRGSLDDGKPKTTEGVPDSAWADCAEILVPADIEITDADSPDDAPETFDQIVVYGQKLAKPGAEPAFSKEGSEGRILGFPTVAGFYFGTDGILWKLKWPETEPTKVGEKK
jgi:hypothetical protein